MTRLDLLPYAAVPVLVASALGCQNTRAVSEQTSADMVTKLVPIVKEDVEQVRRGLPQGAAKLGATLEAEPGQNLPGLQRAIQTARGSVRDLDVAKSTFFSFADTTGTVLRSEADPDMLAGKSIFAAFPALKKATEPGSGIVETFGEMQEARGVRNGPDYQWVVAHPVKNPEGEVKGVFVTGWSFRRFAFHLEETAKRELLEQTQKEGKKLVPLIYVFVLKNKKAYGAPVTPDVSAQAIEALDLLPKTASGLYKATVDITGRSFGLAAQRTPELGDDAAIAVITSEL